MYKVVMLLESQVKSEIASVSVWDSFPFRSLSVLVKLLRSGASDPVTLGRSSRLSPHHCRSKDGPVVGSFECDN